ncbi:nickel-dependent lactate racemase [Planctomycetota bacterium]
MSEIPVAEIAYGRGKVSLCMDPALAQWQVIIPAFAPALPDPQKVFKANTRTPIGTPPLSDLVCAEDRVVIVTSDGTRPVPNQLLIPWLLEELPCPADNIVVLLGNGTHRENTAEEIETMFGPDLAHHIIIANHVADDPRRNEHVGITAAGRPVELDRIYTEADKRIAIGFIEPHFFAGFSGGAKAIIPGIASTETIHAIHNTELIGHPQSDWGLLDENPLRRALEEGVALCPPEFLVNVILDHDQNITDVFCGDYIQAHRAGCAQAKAGAMTPVNRPFPIVITSNSGYPLDQNLYQTVKGMSAAARIVEPGGIIFVASECADGIPAGGQFAEIMQQGATPRDILDWISDQKEVVPDQWQAQALACILDGCEVRILTDIPAGGVEACKIRKIDNLPAALEEELTRRGPDTRVAIMPDGPLTIPYLA